MPAIKQIFDAKSASSWYFISKKLYQYVTMFYESAWVLRVCMDNVLEIINSSQTYSVTLRKNL